MGCDQHRPSASGDSCASPNLPSPRRNVERFAVRAAEPGQTRTLIGTSFLRVLHEFACRANRIGAPKKVVGGAGSQRPRLQHHQRHQPLRRRNLEASEARLSKGRLRREKKRPRNTGAPDFPHSLPRLPFNPSLLRRRSDDDPRYRPAISGEAETGEAERHQRPGRRLGDARDSQGKAARIIVVSARVWAAAE